MTVKKNNTCLQKIKKFVEIEDHLKKIAKNSEISLKIVNFIVNFIVHFEQVIANWVTT